MNILNKGKKRLFRTVQKYENVQLIFVISKPTMLLVTNTYKLCSYFIIKSYINGKTRALNYQQN